MSSAIRIPVAGLTSPTLQKVRIVIPTYNAAPFWAELSRSISLQNIPSHQVLVVDSSSTDGTRSLAKASGYRVMCIPKEEFGHGTTRQLACEYLPEAELLVFMTQDAVLESANALMLLCQALNDPAVGAAYGRQAPRLGASPIERHARLFNYPKGNSVKTFECRHTLGIKAAFCSNSFAVYRRSALQAVGGFPKDVILAEDSVVAARMLMAGWRVAYCADAVAIHSHPLSMRQEFSRYFDTGVHHSREAWLQQVFGKAANEGKLFLRSELGYLGRRAPHLVPVAVLRTLNKFAGYHLGLLQKSMPRWLLLKLSAHPGFWAGQAEPSPAKVTPEKVTPESADAYAESYPRGSLALVERDVPFKQAARGN